MIFDIENQSEPLIDTRHRNRSVHGISFSEGALVSPTTEAEKQAGGESSFKRSVAPRYVTVVK